MAVTVETVTTDECPARVAISRGNRARRDRDRGITDGLDSDVPIATSSDPLANVAAMRHLVWGALKFEAEMTGHPAAAIAADLRAKAVEDHRNTRRRTMCLVPADPPAA